MIAKVALTLSLTAAAWGLAPTVPADAAQAPPNVVIIVTDDQVEGTMDAMPITRRQIQNKGVTLSNGIIPTSTCCPSRSALLSGQYSRTTGVYRNVGANGGWPVFNASGTEAHTLAVALDDVGYRTGLFGKYLNGFALADPGYVPPGWDQFQAIYDPSGSPKLAAGAYYNYVLRGTGEPTAYGSQPDDYSTDVIAEHAVEFVNSTPDGEPLLLYFAPTGPHAPFVAAPRHQELWKNEPLGRAVSELAKNRPSFAPTELLGYLKMQKKVRKQHETLMSVDEAVGQILDALGPRAENTIFVYLSDNGLMFGEHGLMNKYSPYSGATDVPMFIRWDGVIAAGSKYRKPVTNADLAATIADGTGVSLENPDGVSYFAYQRPTGVALEATADKNHPAYCGWRTARYLYVMYDGGESELYDYKTDPDELINQVANPTYAAARDRLISETQVTCSPTPPGFTW